MPEEGLLIGIAEISIALTGFAGVVVVLGRRASGAWSEVDQFRLRSLIENGLIALLTALLPLAVLQLSEDPRTIWGISSGIFGVAGATHAFIVQGRRASRIRGQLEADSDKGFRNFWLWAVVPLSVAVHLSLLLNAFGLLFPRAFGPYLFGLLWYLILGSIFFVRLVRFS